MRMLQGQDFFRCQDEPVITTCKLYILDDSVTTDDSVVCCLFCVSYMNTVAAF